MTDDVLTTMPLANDLQERIERLRATLHMALRGKAGVIEHALVSLLSRGHLLLEDMPGLGKTTLAKALAHSIGGRFARVQCTPDLLPGDITGFNLFNQKTREFEFIPGPVFADVLLVDEINRATPRTQSALLEAMSERQVTVDNTLYPLSETFFVIATQNPVEHHGTYPLPEAQLDRFAMKLQIGYPGRDAEIAMLADAAETGERVNAPCPVLKPGELAGLQRQIACLPVARSVQSYLVELAQAIRTHPEASMGFSPRALLTWQRAAQAHAFLKGRGFVTPDDVQQIAGPVLAVRLPGGFRAADRVLQDLIETVPVPQLR